MNMEGDTSYVAFGMVSERETEKGSTPHESTGVELSLALEKIQIIMGDDREGHRQYPVPSAQDRRIH